MRAEIRGRSPWLLVDVGDHRWVAAAHRSIAIVAAAVSRRFPSPAETKTPVRSPPLRLFRSMSLLADSMRGGGPLSRLFATSSPSLSWTIRIRRPWRLEGS